MKKSEFMRLAGREPGDLERRVNRIVDDEKSITAHVDVAGGVSCPSCDFVMFGRIYGPDASKYSLRCCNGNCKDFGREFLAPRQTIELTPVGE